MAVVTGFTADRMRAIENDAITDARRDGDTLVLITHGGTEKILGSIVGPQGPEGPQGVEGIPGTPGADGESRYVWIKYSNSPDGSNMSDLPTGMSYIGIAYNKLTATESTDPSFYTWALIQGPQGNQGPQGVDGPAGADGKTTYTWIKYATSSTGDNMSDDPAGMTHIGIAYNKLTTIESSIASDYIWALIQGPQGPQGSVGPAGADGQPRYTWIKYATSSTGANMTDSPTGKTYIGIAYNKTTSSESSLASDYEWSLIQGPQGITGPQGIQGPAGADGQPTYTWLKYATSSAGANMSDSPSGMTYIGLAYNKTTPTESNTPSDYAWSLIMGPQGPQGIPGPTGADGQPTYTWVKYATSSSGTGMSDDPTGKTYMGLAYNKTTPTESLTPSDYSWSLIQGPQGPQGTTGPQGIQGPIGPNGEPTYIWIKYATSSTGAGMSDDPAGKTYIGMAYNKTTATESTLASDYSWSLIQGPQGPQGATGATGSTGPTGATGKSVTSVTNYYMLAGATPSVPTTSPPPAPWSTAEPTYTTTASNLYRVIRTILSDNTFSYSAVSMVSAFTAVRAVIDDIGAGKITVASALSGARVVLDSSGLKGYDANGNLKTSIGTDGKLSATDGTFAGNITSTATITGGAFKTAASGQRAEVSGTNVSLIAPNGSAASLTSVDNGASGQLMILQAGLSSMYIGTQNLAQGGSSDASVDVFRANRIYTAGIIIDNDSGWIPMTFASDYQTQGGTAPAFKVVGDQVWTRGLTDKISGQFAANVTYVVGSIPTTFCRNEWIYLTVSGDLGAAQLQILDTGSIRLRAFSACNWVSIETTYRLR